MAGHSVAGATRKYLPRTGEQTARQKALQKYREKMKERRSRVGDEGSVTNAATLSDNNGRNQSSGDNT
jgi:hypothetical protein